MIDRLSAGESGMQRLITSISICVPYQGIDHAGGEYYRQHLTALATMYDLVSVSPGTRQNIESSELVDPSNVQVRLLNRSGLLAHRRFKILRGIYLYLAGPSAGLVNMHAFRRDKDIARSLKNSSVIEFQWTEMASVVKYVKKVAPDVPRILVAHDVVSQKYERRLAAESGRNRRLIKAIRLSRIRRGEVKLIRQMDRIISFSEKDAALLETLAPAVQIVVVRPPLGSVNLGRDRRDRGADTRRVLFTGAMGREENHDGVMWFLDEVWPIVRSAVPAAEFVIAGGSPRAQLIEYASRLEHVLVTGFVESLAPYYDSADVFVSPLRSGAGVKFKTGTAMLHGLPVVATAIGAEGIGEESWYVAVADDPRSFAEALILALSDETSRRTASRVGGAGASALFSTESFASRLIDSFRFED
ncbi:glycosyltransferase [Subtercola sp. RTI3]|uniref:glycosyltransferase n=1 Tax=Subtercola sp. RTI3 TaxID=3048639 RepID=UPI002B2327FB|nr:glycosyltransferase [Subtercola sp. RTI3]MEA9985953.1 glycosyltransferase [Subtercola sp. RTI3]